MFYFISKEYLNSTWQKNFGYNAISLCTRDQIIFHKDDGIIIANVEEYEVTVTKKSGIFQQIILKTSTVTNTVDLNQKPPNETFDVSEKTWQLILKMILKFEC